LKNGYPRDVIHQSRFNPQPERRNIEGTNYFYMKIPFIDDSLNRKLKSIFRSEDINIRFCHGNKTFRNFLRKDMTGGNSCSTNCRFQNICHHKSVVYKMKCSMYSNYYIGSTIRQMHQRIQEHLRSDSSSVWRHLQGCTSSPPSTMEERLQVSILTKDNDPINLRIKEGLFIRRLKPTINSREEMKELDMLI
jgi:hypothetical protein